MKEIIKDVVIAAIIAIIVIQFIRPTVVKESSMGATLFENNYIFLNKQAYTFGEPKRGDIIVFHSSLTREDGSEKLLIKRIIGLPGDTVKVSDNCVYLNGALLHEDYIKEQGVVPGDVEVTVPEGELFVMGDNRRVSIDSRYEEVGCVKIDDVVGKAFFRLFPIRDIGKL